MLDWDVVSCVQGDLLTTFFEKLDRGAECFAICEDSQSFGFLVAEQQVLPGATFMLNVPGSTLR